MPKLTIDNQEIEVPQGTTIMQAASKLSVSIPYYCWHPGLSIAGNCRMCQVEVDKVPRPVIACNTQVTEGMVVRTQSEMAKHAQKGTLEFLLANHPLDCPVCDQAGECELQNFYMKYGLYDSRFDEKKVKKKKAVVIGPTVILDSERCILCSRCVRFTDEITHTGELGIVNRGDHEEITVYPGKELDNKYSGNVVDICPVGALTDRDFRFKCRVWYLESVDSICTGCSQGCNIQIHVNKDRPHHAQGERVMRLKPRTNEKVNQWWMCDAGRYGYKFIDKERLLTPQRREGALFKEEDWEKILVSVSSSFATLFKRHEKSALGVLLSPQLSNEDLFTAKKFFEGLGILNVSVLSPSPKGDEDTFLIKSDKNPNSRGALAIGVSQVSFEDIVPSILKGKIKGLYLFGQDLLSLVGENHAKELLSKLELIVFQGSNQNSTSAHSHYILPSATFAEKEGTFTNHAGRVQQFWKSLEPLGISLPDAEILQRLAEKMGIRFEKKRPEEIFSDLAGSVTAFRGLSYASLGKEGKLLNGH